MYTQCPHCHGIYRIGAAQLGAAAGRVRCGACDAEFDALRWLRDELPPARPAQPDSAELPFADPGDDAGPEAPEPADAPRDSVFALPVDDAAQPSRLMQRFWAAGSAVLACALLAQLVVLAPRGMAHSAELRPTAQAICRFAGCTVPPRHDLSRLRLASRDVRAHPSVPGALMISATLVNEADFTQPFPALEIALADLQGEPVALRRFRPAEYLPERVRVADGMAAGSVVRVNLEVVDPDEQAVAFEFAFRRDA